MTSRRVTVTLPPIPSAKVTGPETTKEEGQKVVESQKLSRASTFISRLQLGSLYCQRRPGDVWGGGAPRLPRPLGTFLSHMIYCLTYSSPHTQDWFLTVRTTLTFWKNWVVSYPPSHPTLYHTLTPSTHSTLTPSTYTPLTTGLIRSKLQQKQNLRYVRIGTHLLLHVVVFLSLCTWLLLILHLFVLS